MDSNKIVRDIRVELTELNKATKDENYRRAGSIASHIHHLSSLLLQSTYSKVTIDQDK